MSSLTDRLRGIVGSSHQPSAPLASLPAPGGAQVTTPPERDNAEAVLGGAWSPDRRAFTVERRVCAETRHGRVVMGDVAAQLTRAAASGVLALLTNQAAAPPFLFFDLETTGLSGGAGTYAFLVGTAWFDDGGFVVRQYLLTDYGAERPMLERVAGAFSAAGSLVSFNGKTFDAPVLDTRYLFHRLTWPGAGLPHVDALHPSRRFWRKGAQGPRESCSLAALEEEILGVRRVGDVPGFEIPSRYFAFVRSGDARPLAAVLEHNRQDLLSLAALLARMLELLEIGGARADDPWEALAIGKTYAAAGDVPRACEALQHAIEMGSGRDGASEAAAVEALRSLALLLRRARRFEESADAWRRLVQVRSCPAVVAREANEALAIHHEHRVRDLAAARTFALQSLENGAGGTDAAWSDAVRHRLRRIERKMAPPSGRTLFPSSTSSLLSRPSCGSQTSGPRTSS